MLLPDSLPSTRELAPVFQEPIVLSGVSDDSPLLANHVGEIAFEASVSGPGVNFNNSGVAVVNRPDGEYQLVAREFDPAPGELEEIVLHSIQIHSFDEYGNVALTGQLRNAAGGFLADDQTLYIFDAESGVLERLLSYGDPAPGFSDGAKFGTNGPATQTSVFFDISLDSNDQLTFRAEVERQNSFVNAVYRRSNGQFDLLAHEDGAVNGLGRGVRYDSISSIFSTRGDCVLFAPFLRNDLRRTISVSDVFH